MSPTYPVDIVYGVKGASAAKRELQGIAGALKNIGVAVSAAAVSRFMRNLQKEAFNFGIEMSKVEGQTKRAYNAMYNLLGPQASGMMQDLRDATQGAVADMELLAIANQFVAMGLASTSDEVVNIARVVSQLELLTNRHESLSAAMGDFSMLIANQSVRRLDQFYLSVGNVNTRMEELEQTTPGVSRQTRFLTAVMEEANAVLAETGEQIVATGEKWEANISNTTRALKLWFATTEVGIGFQERLANTIDYLNERTEKYFDELEASQAADRFNEILRSMNLRLYDTSEAMIYTVNTFLKLKEGVAEGTWAAEDASNALAILAENMYNLTGDERFQQFFEAPDRLSEDLVSAAEEMQALADIQEKYELSLMDGNQQLDYWLAKLQAITPNTEEWYRVAMKINALGDDLTADAAQLADAQFEHSLRLADSEKQLVMLRERYSEVNAESELGMQLLERILDLEESITKEKMRQRQELAQARQAVQMYQMTDTEQLQYWQREMKSATYNTIEYWDAMLEALKIEDRIAAGAEKMGTSLSDMQSAIESILQPTAATDLDWAQTRLGTYTDKWDEYIRRVKSAATQADSAWKHLIPTEVLERGSDAIKVWAAETEAAFYAGRLPDKVNWKGFDKAYAEYMADKAARELLVQTAMARVGGAKADVSRALGISMDVVGSTNALAESMAKSAEPVESLADNMPLFDDAVMGATESLDQFAQRLGGWIGIPGYQTGTHYAQGGWSLVGERGPEMIRVPRGSEIKPNTTQFMGGINITVAAPGGGQPYSQGMELAHGIMQGLRARGIV